jgi:Dolichyl-phosphate-mannose-protein mannosyltransferase
METKKFSLEFPASRCNPFLPVLLYAALVGYFHSFSQYGFNIWDEGGFANGTLRTFNGQQALQDFNPNGYLPGRYIYGALFFKLFGVDILSLRLSVILLTPGMIFMVYAISRRIMPPGFAFLAALFMLSAPSMYYNRFFPFFTVLNLYCLLNVLDKKRIQDFLLLGGSVLLAGYFKFEIALIALLISLALIAVIIFQGKEGFLLHRNIAEHQSPKSRWLLWVSGVFLAAAFSATLWYFLQQDFFGKVFTLVVEAHNVWGNPFPDFFPFTTLLEKLGPHKMFERLLFYLPLWVYGAVGIVLLRRFIQPKMKTSPKDFALLILLSFGICVFGLVIWRAGFDNLLRTLPPFYILFCYLLYLAHKNVLHLLGVSEETTQPVALLKKIPVNVFAVFLPFVFFYEMNTHHGFYAGSIGAMKHETQLVSLERLKVYTHPSEAKWLEEVVDRIEIYTDKGDPILALPLNPVFYFLTDRINPTRYDWVLPGMLTPEEEKGMVEQLKNAPPKVIVYVDIPIDGKEERRLANYAPQLYGFIAENYRFDEMIGLFQILLPNKTR